MANVTANGTVLWDALHDPDKVDGMFGWCNSQANQLKFWMVGDKMMWICIIIVIQWHLRYRCGCFSCVMGCGRPGMTLCRMALHLLVFNIYYNQDLHEKRPSIKRKPFCASVLLIFLDSFGIFWLFAILSECTKSVMDKNGLESCMKSMGNDCHVDPTTFINDQSKYEKDPTEDYANDDGIDDDGAETATCSYMDVTCDLIKTAGLWLAQSILVFFYIDNLNDDKKSKLLSRCHVVNWICAVLLQLLCWGQAVGQPSKQNILAPALDKRRKGEKHSP